MANQIGIEMAEAIPGFAKHFDIPDLVGCFAPRPLFIVSAIEDKLSFDATSVVSIVEKQGAASNLVHKRYVGGHALTQERFDDIVRWLLACMN